MRARKKGIDLSPNDIGPKSRKGTPWLAQHADVSVVAMPVIGKRARRDYIHDRLYRQSLITREEHDAAEDWARLHALAAGARIGESRPLEKIDGRSGSEPAEWTVDALTALRSQYRRVGHWGSAVLVLAICDGASLRAVARQFCGGDGGRACEAAEALIVGALGRLAKTLDVRRD